MLEVSGLRKTFSGFVAIADVSFSVERRQIAAVIGPNGAGKSTLFNLITGHIRPETGQVRFDNSDITGAAAVRYMPNGRGPVVSARQHISEADRVRECAGRVHRASRRRPRISGRSRAAYSTTKPAVCCGRLGCIGQADTISGTLSYGNQKQLELGIALAADPKMLLLDEPTAGMSASETRATIELLQQIALERELTLLFTEHDMDVVFAIAQKIAVLHQGRLIAAGSPMEVRGNPEVRRVYLGEQRQ